MGYAKSNRGDYVFEPHMKLDRTQHQTGYQQCWDTPASYPSLLTGPREIVAERRPIDSDITHFSQRTPSGTAHRARGTQIGMSTRAPGRSGALDCYVPSSSKARSPRERIKESSD